MKKVGILYHPMKEEALPLAQDLQEFLGSKGVATWVCSAWEVDKARAQLNGTDLVLSVGGDGTILRAAQVVVPGTTPVTGVNLGKLGFMTELSVKEAKDELVALLNGEGWIDERSLLEAELPSVGEGNESSGVFYALNDVVAARGTAARVTYVEARINDELLTTYKADGVILATATGSTGYALAAGGPILHPQAGEIVLVSILPHLSWGYPLVLPSTAVIKLHVTATHPATLSIDGHINLTLNSGSDIIVRRSRHTVRFLRIHPKDSFYGTLEQKLKGKQ